MSSNTSSSILSFIQGMGQTLSFDTTAVTSEFSAYLNSSDLSTIPDNPAIRAKFLDFLKQDSSSLAAFITAAIQSVYGSSTAEDELSLIEEFQASLGLQGQPLETANESELDKIKIRQQFLYFLSSPVTLAAQSIYGISSDAADSIASFRTQQGGGSPMTDTAQQGQDYLQMVASGGTPDTNIVVFLQNTLQGFSNTPLTDDLVAKFRKYAGLDPSAPLDSPETRALFVAFLHDTLSSAQASEAVNAISPAEQDIRSILFSAFSIVLKMLSTLQKAIQVESKALDFYANWESRITDMVSATPLYGPTANTQIVANDTDFGKTSLGFGNITVRDMVSYLYNQIQQNGTSDETFDITNPTINFPRFELIKNPNGTYTINIRPENGSSTIFMTATATVNTLLTATEQQSDVVNNLVSGLTTYWNSLSSIVVPNQTVTVTTRDSISGALSGTANSNISIDLKQVWKQGGGAINPALPYTLSSSSDLGGYDNYRDSLQNWMMAVTSSANTLNILYGANNFPSGTVQSTALPTMLQQIAAQGWNGTTFNYDPSLYIYYAGVKGKLTFSLTETGRSADGSQRTYNFMWYLNGTILGSSVYNFSGTLPGVTATVNPLTSVAGGLWGPWQSAWPETIPYAPGFNPASMQTIRTTASQYRGDVNSQLQLYIQGAQARSSNIDTSMKTMQNLISQTTQATTNQTNLLDLIMQTMTSILTTLFR